MTKRRVKRNVASTRGSDQEEEHEVVLDVEEDSDYSDHKKKRKKKKASEEKPKKKSKKAASSSNDVEEEIVNDTTMEEHNQEDIIDTKEEEIELSLDSINFDNEFTMKAVNHVKESINFLDSIEANYPNLPSAERQAIISILKHLQNKVGKLGDLCKSAELLLFRGKNHDMSEYGLLNSIQLPEIWSTVFSFLNFGDFLKASQVCKTWQAASLHPCALTCFNLDFRVDYSIMHYVTIYTKYISWRLEHIRTVWELPMRLCRWLSLSGVVFPNAKYNDVNYKVTWEDEQTPNNNGYEISGIDLCPKSAKKSFEPQFTALWSFFDAFGTLSGLDGKKKTVPADSISAKIMDNNLEFEDPTNIEELVIYKTDESKLPEFTNLKKLDMTHLLRMRDPADFKYSFKSTSLTKLSVPYSFTFDEIEDIVRNLLNIRSLQLVDGGAFRNGTKIISNLDMFNNLTELDIDTLTESDIIKFPSSIRKLKIGKVVEKNAKIFPLLINVEELYTTEQVLSHINLLRLPKLKTVLIYNNSSNHNKQITIESSTIETICLLTYNSINIRCPNLYDLRLGPGLKQGSDSVYIKSNKLTNFKLERDIQMLSIQGPNFVADGKILSRVKNIVDLECPLIDRAYVKSLSSINQGDSFRTLLTKQIKNLNIAVTYFDLFNTKTEIQHLTISNWKSSQIITSSKLNVYRKNLSNYKSLKIIGCSAEVVNLLNSIFNNSTDLESLTIEDTSYDAEYLGSLSDSACYPNIRTLSLVNIGSLKPQIGTAFLKTCDKRPLLNRIEINYRSSYRKKYPTYIPIHCSTFISQLSGCQNTEALPNLTSLTLTSGTMGIDYSAFQFFPNLKYLHFSPSCSESSTVESDDILEHCKKLECVISSTSLPKKFSALKENNKDITIAEHA